MSKKNDINNCNQKFFLHTLCLLSSFISHPMELSVTSSGAKNFDNPRLPLGGMRVCEISHHLSAPLCGRYLAEMGADVVRLEAPSGDRMRGIFANGADYGAPFAATNKGKRLIRIDLRAAAGLERAKAILQGCDALITNLQPDTLLRLGLGPEAVRGFNPGIIYVSLTSCGWDARFRNVKMDDGAAQAASGLALSTGWPDSGPVLVPVPIAATVSALFGAIAVAAAWSRGSATSIDCALLDSMAMCLEFPLMQAATFGKVPAKNGGRHPTSSPSQPFKTKDGFLAIMAASDASVRALLGALDLNELANDDRFSSYAGRMKNRDELEAKIEMALMRETTLIWFEKLSALGIACAPMQTLPEAVDHAKAHYYSTIRPLWLRGTSIDTVAMPGGRAARGLQETIEPIEVQDAGWCGPQDLRPLQKASTLLSGVRVLDLTRFLSGPFATFLLSELGADVLKIEPPGGDPTRQFSPILEGQSGYFTSINRGKRTVEIDLKTTAGREWLLSELALADILIENYRPGVMERLGLTESVLKARNPKLVTLSISGYGSGRTFGDRAAFDMTMQAFTGIMTQTGYADYDYTRLGFSAGDIVTGLFAAFGAVAELAGVSRTQGPATSIEIQMFDALLAVMEPLIVRNSVGHPAEPKKGARHSGGCPIGFFRCRDGYVYFSASDDAGYAAAMKILKLNDTHPGLAGLDRTARGSSTRAIETAVETACLTWKAEELLQELNAAGIVSSLVQDPLSASRSPLFVERGLFEDRDGFRLVRTPIRDIRMKTNVQTDADGSLELQLGQ